MEQEHMQLRTILYIYKFNKMLTYLNLLLQILQK